MWIENRHTKMQGRIAGKVLPKDADKMVYIELKRPPCLRHLHLVLRRARGRAEDAPSTRHRPAYRTRTQEEPILGRALKIHGPWVAPRAALSRSTRAWTHSGWAKVKASHSIATVALEIAIRPESSPRATAPARQTKAPGALVAMALAT